MTTLRDVMSTSVTTMEASATIAEAAAKMVQGRFGSVLVTQRTMLLGIFTERDVMRAAAEASDLQADTLSKWMTPDPITRPPETAAEEAAELMLSNGFRHLPVVDDSGLVGIVSLRDLLSARIGR
jgi:CBS domain-containing protein